MDNKFKNRIVLRGANMVDFYIGQNAIVELIATDIQTLHVMEWVDNATLIVDDASDVHRITGSGKLNKMTLTEMLFPEA